MFRTRHGASLPINHQRSACSSSLGALRRRCVKKLDIQVFDREVKKLDIQVLTARESQIRPPEQGVAHQHRRQILELMAQRPGTLGIQAGGRHAGKVVNLEQHKAILRQYEVGPRQIPAAEPGMGVDRRLLQRPADILRHFCRHPVITLKKLDIQVLTVT